MKIIHFCAGLEGNNGMANTARQFVAEERARGDESQLTNELAKIERGVDRVMIHGAWLPVLWRAAKRAKAVGAELVIRPAGSYDPVRLAFHGWKKRLVAFFEHRMLRRADVVLATCEAERRWIRAYERGIRDQGSGIRVEITDLKRFFDLDKPKPKSGVEQRNLHVLYLGRRHPLKGVEFLERAVREIQVKVKGAIERSEIAEGPREQWRVELRIVSDHFGEELEKDWAWCDVLVLPTLSENFGRVVAEALERGKKVITTDGAPAWEPPEAATKSKSEVEVEQWWDRLLYLRGYRDGTDEERVKLLKKALEKVSSFRFQVERVELRG